MAPHPPRSARRGWPCSTTLPRRRLSSSCRRARAGSDSIWPRRTLSSSSTKTGTRTTTCRLSRERTASGSSRRCSFIVWSAGRRWRSGFSTWRRRNCALKPLLFRAKRTSPSRAASWTTSCATARRSSSPRPKTSRSLCLPAATIKRGRSTSTRSRAARASTATAGCRATSSRTTTRPWTLYWIGLAPTRKTRKRPRCKRGRWAS
mmetsp:Transcript_34723/g.121078  ORF Transcript_34723/g.121078 Transcript_34723/m.121078 type:complete len:205 (+) Transcript_34723:2023-2637(+)